jgi:hypothetical protein
MANTGSDIELNSNLRVLFSCDGRFVTFRFVVGAEEPGDPQRLSRAEAVKIGKQVAETGIYDSISASPHVVKSFGRHLWRYGEEGK